MEHYGERFAAAKQGKYYTPAETETFFQTLGKPGTHHHKKVEYVDLICALDLETTSFRLEGGAALGTMYVWMFGCNGAVMIGRTWAEFEGFFANFVWHFKLSAEKRRCVIFVHNNAFDFQFYRKHFVWHEIFARSEREPMYALSEGGLEFRCSYILTNSKLATVAKNLIRFPVDKQVGDLDYELPRTSHTPLTDHEIGYCIHDVLVVMSLIYDRMQLEKGNIAKIPLTQTGYARRECRAECLYKDRKARKYLYLMRDLTLTKDEYTVAKAAFSGGFTHASPYRVNSVGFHLGSYDFTSSYPAVMVGEQFPMSRGVEVSPSKIKSRADLDALCDQWCVLMILEFDSISATTEQDYYISESRCTAQGEDCFNGRVASADNLIICCTDVDWQVIKEAYEWERFRVRRLWTYKRRYLPTPYVRTVLDLYRKKTELKGVPGKEEEYARAKELLNSLYGMMATQIDRPEVHYDDDQEWYSTDVDIDEVLEDYNTDTRRFISYLWGCFVTAYARRNLWTAILTLGGDYWYSDTDSVKVSNYREHEAYFNNYNTWIQQKLERACDYHRISYDYIRPKTIKGKEKPLGVWDYEGEMQRFKTLGAKRYLYTTIEGGKEVLHITCAGVAKTNAVEYLLYQYKDLDSIFEAFADGLVFPGRYYDGEWKSGTGKMTHLYYDDEFIVDLTDYLGYTETVHELSCINLSSADYNLGIAGMFWEYLRRYWQGIDLKE